MKTKAVRLYGKNDIRLEEFELPQIRESRIRRTQGRILAFEVMLLFSLLPEEVDHEFLAVICQLSGRRSQRLYLAAHIFG